MRYWLYLAAAIAAEVTGTSLLKWGADTGNLLGLAAMSVLLLLFLLVVTGIYLLAVNRRNRDA